MSLEHQFFLISKDMIVQDTVLDYSLVEQPGIDVCRLHDDIISYIGDSLRWIPTQNPSFPESTYGLNRCGITLIGTEGAPVMRGILRAWMDLFGNGPDNLYLTGDYSWGNLEGIETGEYLIINLDRDTLLDKLSRLHSLCDKALAEGLVVVHFGI